MKNNQKTENGRRSFLRSSLLAGGAVAVLPLAGTAEAKATPSLKNDKGYHFSEHVRRYYESARRI